MSQIFLFLKKYSSSAALCQPSNPAIWSLHHLFANRKTPMNPSKTTHITNNYYTHTVFCFKTPPLLRNLKPFSITLTTCPFHFTACKKQIWTQRFFKFSNISSHFSDIDPTFHTENRIPNCTSGDFLTIWAQVHTIFLLGFSTVFLTEVGTDITWEVLEQCQHYSNVIKH